MLREVHIVSYFSFTTDLANELRDWPEFRSGVEYSVDLCSTDRAEVVTVRLMNDDGAYVAVKSVGNGSLFERVLGRVTYALAANSDSLMVYRIA